MKALIRVAVLIASVVVLLAGISCSPSSKEMQAVVFSAGSRAIRSPRLAWWWVFSESLPKFIGSAADNRFSATWQLNQAICVASFTAK